MENMVIKARKGLDMTEATQVELKNVQLITEEVNPVMNIHNSRQILLSGIGYQPSEVLLRVTGEKSSQIILTNTEKEKAGKLLELNYGAASTAVQIK